MVLWLEWRRHEKQIKQYVLVHRVVSEQNTVFPGLDLSILILQSLSQSK